MIDIIFCIIGFISSLTGLIIILRWLYVDTMKGMRDEYTNRRV